MNNISFPKTLLRERLRLIVIGGRLVGNILFTKYFDFSRPVEHSHRHAWNDAAPALSWIAEGVVIGAGCLGLMQLGIGGFGAGDQCQLFQLY